MRLQERGRTIIAIGLFLLPEAGAARDDATSILYLEAAGWRQAAPAHKIELAANFMRVFCTDPLMSPESLAACLDDNAGAGPVFEQAITCASSIARR